MSAVDKRTIEDHRESWAALARKHGWYVEPFYVQVWMDSEGVIIDSVSFRGMTQDIIIEVTEE